VRACEYAAQDRGAGVCGPPVCVCECACVRVSVQLKIAEPGSVAFNFDRVGLVSIETADGEDAVSAIGAGRAYLRSFIRVASYTALQIRDGSGARISSYGQYSLHRA
jgi:hypothetical protein